LPVTGSSPAIAEFQTSVQSPERKTPKFYSEDRNLFAMAGLQPGKK